MEEILASIRRIISEDDAPTEAQPAAAAAPAPEPEPEPQPEPAPAPAPEAEPAPAPAPAMYDETPSVQEPVASEEDVLVLTDNDRAESIGDLDVSPAPAPEPAAAPEPDPFPTAFTPEPAPAPAPAPAPEPIAAAVTTALVGGTTVEELVRSIVEPQVKSWLDQNLDGLLRDILRERLDRVFR